MFCRPDEILRSTARAIAPSPSSDHDRSPVVRFGGLANPPRDAFIGWSVSARRAGLSRITNNTRFLIPEWVHVPHLARHILARVSRRIDADWQTKYGHRLHLLETFAVVRVLCEGSHQLEGQQRQLEAQQKKIAELKQTVARLSKNSSNSSKPPSSDITQPKAKSHGQSQNKIGAQPGHPKHERALFPQGDIQTFHDDRLSACPKCDNPAVTFLDLPPRLIQPMELETFVVQFCIAPLIRDIKDLTGLPDAETPAYGKKLLAAVNVRFEVIHERENLAPDAFLRALERAHESLLEAALNGVPSRLDPDGQEQKREAFNLAQRFRENGKAYFEFILQAIRAYFRDRPAPSLLPGFT